MDVTKGYYGIFGSSVELIQAGGLDGLTKEDQSLCAGRTIMFLVSRHIWQFCDLCENAFILPRLQAAIKKMEEEGCALVMMFCTRQLSRAFHRKNPL